MNGLHGKTILLTGGGGFVGQRLLARLERVAGARLVVLTEKSPPEDGECTYVPVPLEKLSRETWIEHGIDTIDIVFHLASFIPKCARDSDSLPDIFRSNLIGTRALLESAPSPIEKIIFSSTVDVYSRDIRSLITEESRIDPPSLYGASKFFCENLVRNYAKTHGWGYAILRYGHIYGPGEAAYSKLIPQAIRAILKGEPPIIYGDGCVLRNFTHVDDAVEATIRAGSSELAEIDPVNIVSDMSLTINDIIGMLTSIAGASRHAEYRHELPGGSSMCFDNARMRAVLGEWGKIEMREGLAEEIEYFRGRDEQ